ncbi:MAG: TetR/AcrR family transcriptional regulator [Myxococcota bacterium]
MTKGAATKQAIIEQAMGVASTVGLEGLSIGELSKTLGLSKSGLFAHFRSKERLQLEVLGAAEKYFVDEVVRPAIRAPRGEPRVQALFDNWLRWAQRKLPGGCLFVAAATEFDDRPGIIRDAVVKAQNHWVDTLTRAAAIAQEEGHFRADLDPRLFAFEFNALTLSAHFFHRLLEATDGMTLARRSFEAVISRARA